MAALGMLWMGLALLGLLGFPQTLAQGEDHVSVQPYFQQNKFLGPWYVAALIPNTSLFRDKKNFICKTVLLGNSTDGGISLTSTFPRRNHRETKIMMQPGKVPGQYHYPSPYSSNVQTISVVETNYDEYALLLSRVTKGTKGTGQPIYKSMLYSRTPTIKDELKEKFTNFSRAYGLTEEDIDFESQLDKCI